MAALRLALAGALAASIALSAGESGTAQYSAAAIARGRYLAHAVCECFECHSPLQDNERHRVNNADPPTYCPRCGRRHGLGELNSP